MQSRVIMMVLTAATALALGASAASALTCPTRSLERDVKASADVVVAEVVSVQGRAVEVRVVTVLKGAAHPVASTFTIHQSRYTSFEGEPAAGQLWIIFLLEGDTPKWACSSPILVR